MRLIIKTLDNKNLKLLGRAYILGVKIKDLRSRRFEIKKDVKDK